MTSLRDRPLLPLVFAVLLAFALLGSAIPASARGDDFEYGRALAELGMKTGDKAYFDYARRVYQGVIEDPNTSEAEKDLCRYGLAEMKRNEAMGAAGNRAFQYPEIVKLFEEAVTEMERFVDKNPDHKRAAEARLAVGTTRLGFVQWARDRLLGDPDYAALRGAPLDRVQEDANNMVRGAIRYFDKLRQGHDQPKASEMSQVAQFYWVRCQYFLALVETPQTTAAKEAFANAAKHLDDFVTLNDGTLLAFYAQDIFGLTRWEQAKQTDEPAEKEKLYGRALEWFTTCIETPVETPEEEAVVASGYYHLGQVCREAGRMSTRNFHREGSNYLQDMESRYPTLWRQDNGIKALLEWARIENLRDRQAEAIEIASRARGYAKKLGKGWLENQANKLLQQIVAGSGSGGASIAADADVLVGIADNFFNEQKYDQAIAAYQKVIGAVRPTKDNIDRLVRSWERIAASYRQQGDLVASAIALEPVHDMWIDGLVEKPGPEEANLIRFGNIRLRSQRAWKELYDVSGSSLFRGRFTEIRDSFSQDYPDHPASKIGDWNSARDKLSQALKQREANNSRWRSTLNEADELFQRVAADKGSEKQDAAWTYQMYTQYLRDNWKGILKVYDDAMAFWNSKAAKDQAKQFPTVAQRRKPEIAKAGYWKAEAHYQLEQWDEILKTLDGWHVENDALKGQGHYYSSALGHLVFAYIGKGDIPNADKQFKKLLAVDPNYALLPKITFKLAEHFNDKARAIDKDRKEARVALNGSVSDPAGGARTKLRITERNEVRTVGYLVDLQRKKEKLQDLVRVYEEKKAKGLLNNIPEDDYESAKKEIPELAKEIASLSERANKLTAEKQALQKEVADLVEKIKRLAQELYEPLTRAASYYWEWDEALDRNDLKRDPNNVAIFADLYYKAGLLRPEEKLNWERAKKLYEDFLKMEGAEKAKRQEAIGRLGTIYSRLAAAAPADTPERADLVKKALDRLQSSLADVPENNDLIVGLLEGKVVVIPYRKGNGPLNRFPLPRVSTVEEFRRAVETLGKAGGPPIPKFEEEIENKRYERAVNEFRVFVQGMKEADIERTVKGFENAGFDVAFFKLHAESGVEFRLAMAWIYAESGVRENMTKAYNLASSVTTGRFAADENSEEWWAAQVIRVRALVAGAEIDFREAGAKSSPSAVEWTRRASKMLRGLNTSNPDLGDDQRPETRDELKELNQRIELLRSKAGLKPMNLILDKLPPFQPGANKDGDRGGDDEQDK